MKELSSVRDGFIDLGGCDGSFSIIKVLVEMEDGEQLYWWKIYHWRRFHGRNFVAHAPSKEAAYEQIDRLRNGTHTHLGCSIISKVGERLRSIYKKMWSSHDN